MSTVLSSNTGTRVSEVAKEWQTVTIVNPHVPKDEVQMIEAFERYATGLEYRRRRAIVRARMQLDRMETPSIAQLRGRR